MNVLSWLHLSDFHIGKDDYAEHSLLDELLTHIKNKTKSNELPDVIFITGDISCSGASTQYEIIIDFINKLNEIYIHSSKHLKLYVVPGNHDVERNRNKLIEPSLYHYKETIPRLFDPSSEGMKHRRENIIPRFQNFISAMEQTNCHPIADMFTDKGYYLDILDKNNLKIGIAGINTAWLSYSDNDKLNMSPGLNIVHNLVKEISKCDYKIILGHHPLTWFNENDETTITNLFVKNGILYLNGHLHRNNSYYCINNLMNNCLLSIGAGAAFQTRESDYLYNSILWGKINMLGDVMITPLKWSKKQDDWILDVSEYLPYANKKEGTDYWVFKLNCHTENIQSINEHTDSEEYYSFSKVVLPEAESLNADKFYDGFPPSFSDLNAGFDFKRFVYTKNGGIKETVNEILACNSFYTQFLLIKGVGGSGKSTLLKRIAFDLCIENKTVFILKADWLEEDCPHTLQHQIKILAESCPECIIFIDDVSECIKSNQLNLIELLNVLTSKKILFVMADTPNRWNSIDSKVRALISSNTLKIFNLQQLDEWECEELIDKMLYLEHCNKLSIRHLNLNKEERLLLFKQNSDRHFVVAMHQIRYGQRFSDIIINEYENIPSELGKELYLLTCLCNYIDIRLPYSLAFIVLKLKNNIEINEVISATEGILMFESEGISPRHSRIAKEIFIHFFKMKEQAFFLLNKLFSATSDCKNQKLIKTIYNKLFTSNKAYKQIVKVLDKDNEMVDEILETIINADYFAEEELYEKYLVFNANIQRKLNNNKKAFTLFRQIIIQNPTNSYAYRQLAWIEHEVQNWEEAAKNAIKAYTYSKDSPEHILQIALLLALNNFSNFKKASFYFKTAVEISNNDEKYLKKLQQYQDAEKMLSYISSINENDLVPPFIAEIFNPPLSFYRNYYRCNTKEYRKRLIYALDRMSSSTNDNSDSLTQAISGYNINGDNLIKSKYYSNLARILYLQWYTNEKIIDSSEIYCTFKKSLQLNNEDAFTHCWLGTYYKEVVKDFDKAEKEYRTAISLSNKALNKFLNKHPIFTNNLGLLIMDGVMLGIYEPKQLYEAKNMFDLSIQYNNDGYGEFYWAEYNLSRCLDLIMKYFYEKKKK